MAPRSGSQFRLRRMYPNIMDMINSPAFRIKEGCHQNCVMHFWSLIGAKWQKPSKYECGVCGVPLKKRGLRKYLVCNKCINRYLIDVKVGVRELVLFSSLESVVEEVIPNKEDP